MLSIPMILLICAMTSGIWGFGVGSPPSWTWGKTSFVVFFVLAIALFVRNELKRPSLLWAVYDDLRERQLRRRLTIRLSLQRLRRSNEQI